MKKQCHQKGKKDRQYQPNDLAEFMNARLCVKYNHSDKYYYLRELRDSSKKRKMNIVKDYDMLYQNKEILEKYIDNYHYQRSFNEALGYYKYYQDIPRLYQQDFQTIIQKHVESKRIKKYKELKLLPEQHKDSVPSQTYSNFMSLLRQEANKAKSSQQNTLLCLKQQLSFIIQKKEWVNNIEPLSNVSTNCFSFLDTDKWNNFVRTKNVLKIQNPLPHSGSMQLVSMQSKFTNTKIKQQLLKKGPSIRTKTMNFTKKSTPFTKRQSTQRSQKQNTHIKIYAHNRSQSKSPPSRPKTKLMHMRMHSEPFSKQKYLNHYLIAAMEMQRNIQGTKLKRKRKTPSTLKQLQKKCYV